VVQANKAIAKSSVNSLKGRLSSQFSEKKLMHLIIENDKEAVEDGKLLKEAYNQGYNQLHPLIYEQLAEDYKLAERLYGKTIIRLITGYSIEYLKQNLKIPEFKLKLKGEINEKLQHLIEAGYLDKEGKINKLGTKLASIVLYIEELERFMPKGNLSGFLKKQVNNLGEAGGDKAFQRNIAYRDIDLRKTIKLAARRRHTSFIREDFVARERIKRGLKWIIFALDVSSSMRGEKLDFAKKAGIALAFKAIEEGNRIGLIVFSTRVLNRQAPTKDFSTILHKITQLSPKKETNIASAIREAIELFPKSKQTKHIIMLTDALPTYGKAPETAALSEVSKARAQDISFSLVGIKLDKQGESFAKKLTELGNGRLYISKQISGMDKLVLTDYYSLQ